MSLHIMYNHQCPQCEAYYIPYDKIPCPNCGLIEKERHDITEQIVVSANYQQQFKGRYTPIAWWIGSFGDHIALSAFKVLDKYYEQDEKSFKEVSLEYFNGREWGKQLYLKDHIRDISYRVFIAIENEKVTHNEGS